MAGNPSCWHTLLGAFAFVVGATDLERERALTQVEVCAGDTGNLFLSLAVLAEDEGSIFVSDFQDVNLRHGVSADSSGNEGGAEYWTSAAKASECTAMHSDASASSRHVAAGKRANAARRIGNSSQKIACSQVAEEPTEEAALTDAPDRCWCLPFSAEDSCRRGGPTDRDALASAATVCHISQHLALTVGSSEALRTA